MATKDLDNDPTSGASDEVAATAVPASDSNFREPKSLKTILSDLRHPAPGSRPVATKDVVNGLDKRERMYGALLMAIDLVLTIAVYVEWHHNKNTKLANLAPDLLIVGIIGVAFMALGLAFRRRALLGFASFLVGMAFISFGLIYGLLYLIFGGWLITRVMRKQRLDRGQTPKARAASTNATKKATGPRAPAASKRYTPPRRTAAKGR